MHLLIALILASPVLIASLVTGHGLLRSADVPSAPGWSAIAWLPDARRGRGLVVGSLLEPFGSNYRSSGAETTIRQEGRPVAPILHFRAPRHLPFLNLHNHKKLLIVAGAASCPGGLNISGQNLAEGA